MIPPTPISTLFPYTTLFRSHDCGRKKCHGCGKSFLERDFPQRQLECELRRCWQCKKSGILKKEFPQHLQLECGKKRSEEHTSELQSHSDLVCRLLLEKKNNK